VNPVLSFSALEHAYAGKTVLRATFAPQALNAGEIALLMGPSGSGKSTLLTVFSGLLLPTQGAISVSGVAWNTLCETARDRHRAKTIGYLPQTAHLLPTLNVIDNVMLPYYFAKADGDARARATQLLSALSLSHRSHARVQTLSQGETQRVALCRALINQPALILADEPTANLDDASAARAAEMLVNAAREQGAALVIATHDARVKNAIPTAHVWPLTPC
jgi:putative ABC transport system ATP-binding protein